MPVLGNTIISTMALCITCARCMRLIRHPTATSPPYRISKETKLFLQWFGFLPSALTRWCSTHPLLNVVMEARSTEERKDKSQIFNNNILLKAP